MRELCVDQCEYYDNGRCLGTREMDPCSTVSCPKNKKTTEQMTNFETGAVRDTGGKGRMDLIPWCAVIRVSKHMEDALAHYPERNWEKGLPMHSMVDSAFRHLAKYTMGMKDEDHLCAAATNLLMAMWTEENMPSMQDIPVIAEGGIEEQIPGQTSLFDVKCPLYNDQVSGAHVLPVCAACGEECSCGGNLRCCDRPDMIKAL